MSIEVYECQFLWNSFKFLYIIRSKLLLWIFCTTFWTWMVQVVPTKFQCLHSILFYYLLLSLIVLLNTIQPSYVPPTQEFFFIFLHVVTLIVLFVNEPLLCHCKLLLFNIYFSTLSSCFPGMVHVYFYFCIRNNI